MAISLYFDVHVDYAITAQLRLRQVDVLTAQEDNSRTLTDEQLLSRATSLRKPIFTNDIRFKALADEWVVQGRPFFGLIFGHLKQVTIGQSVRDLELIAKGTEESDW